MKMDAFRHWAIEHDFVLVLDEDEVEEVIGDEVKTDNRVCVFVAPVGIVLSMVYDSDGRIVSVSNDVTNLGLA